MHYLKTSGSMRKLKKEIKYLETNKNENVNYTKSIWIGLLSCSVMSNSLWLYGLQPTRLLSPWDFPGKNTGVGCHVLLQRIFPTERSNPGLLHCRRFLYQLSHKVNPRILEGVAYPFFRGTSQPRNQT